MDQKKEIDFRPLTKIVNGLPATDGAGVSLTRLIGQPGLEMIDPFLLLDAFSSDRPDDYIAGFPAHPHRGFETVTYMLAGRMRHADSAGHEGVIEPGGVQWMSAARGIVHSEMPEQSDGLLAGFQLWINLPAAHKMDPPAYQEFSPDEIPLESRSDGTIIRVIAGRTDRGTEGVVKQPLTDPYYWDISLPAQIPFTITLPIGHNGFIHVFEGSISAPAATGGNITLAAGQLGVLGAGNGLHLQAGAEGARFLLAAARPIGEPVCRGGPFVMNSREEILQAMDDYRNGRLG